MTETVKDDKGKERVVFCTHSMFFRYRDRDVKEYNTAGKAGRKEKVPGYILKILMEKLEELNAKGLPRSGANKIVWFS